MQLDQPARGDQAEHERCDGGIDGAWEGHPYDRLAFLQPIPGHAQILHVNIQQHQASCEACLIIKFRAWQAVTSPDVLSPQETLSR